MKKLLVIGSICMLLFSAAGCKSSVDDFAKKSAELNKAAEDYSAASDFNAAVNSKDTSNAIVSNTLSGDAAKQKAALRVMAEKAGVKLKDLNSKQLQKLKDKNSDIKEEIEVIKLKQQNTEFGSKEYSKLNEKLIKLLEEQIENSYLIDYNEIVE